MFSEIDKILEAQVPVFSAIFISHFIFNDPFLIIVSYSVTTTWYSMSHDEYLKQFHYYHHKCINSNYSVYINLPDYGYIDNVKAIVKR